MMPRADWSQRADLTERLDASDCPEIPLRRTLAHFKVMNRLVSRYPEILTQYVIHAMQRDPSREYRLTDLGAGGCDVSRWLIRRCRREGLRLTIVALDRDQRVLRYAIEANQDYPEIKSIQADALDTAAWGKPDFIFANHLLHHLPDSAGVELLQRIGQTQPRLYLISDIVRSRKAYWTFRLAFTFFFHGSFIVEDGLTSIRRSFNRHEVLQLIDRAGLTPRPQARFLAPARFLIAGVWLGSRSWKLLPH